jgi:hypothetical protein
MNIIVRLNASSRTFATLVVQPTFSMIFFYSSDYNALFKKDILSVLSLPKGHCVHFRYWESIIAPDVLRDLNSITNRQGLIIYVKGNTANLPEAQRLVQFFPVRKVLIVNFRMDDQTQLYHFHLELGDFVDPVVTHPAVQSSPPYLFVNYGTIQSYVQKHWYEKVEALVNFDPSFKEAVFYNVKLLRYDGGTPTYINIPFDKEEEASFYRLSETNSYVIDLSILISDNDTKELEKYECKLEYDQKDFLISNPSTIVIGAQKDNRRYKLITKSIENHHSFDYLKIIATKKTSATDVKEFYETIIRFKVCKSKMRAIKFVGLSFLNVIGTALFAYLIGEKQFTLIPVALVLVVASSLGQYYYYNKS